MSSQALAAARWRPCKSARRRPGRSRRLAVCAQYRARYSMDVRFGSKMEAVALLQEWVRDVGSQAGLTPQNTQMATGSIGAPESTLELEVAFDSLADLEAFWASIPQQAHLAWGQRMRQFIVHGTPQWHVYRCLPAFPEGSAGLAGPAAAAAGGGSRAPLGGSSSGRSAYGGSSGESSGGLVMPSEDELSKFPPASPSVPSTAEQTASGLSIVSGEEEAQVVLDWKGDAMKINPGDKLPFKF